MSVRQNLLIDLPSESRAQRWQKVRDLCTQIRDFTKSSAASFPILLVTHEEVGIAQGAQGAQGARGVSLVDAC